MEVDDFTRLRKLLQLSLSDNDNEALAAIRKANAVLKNRGMNWEDFFKFVRTKKAMTMEEYSRMHGEAIYAAFGVHANPMSVADLAEMLAKKAAAAQRQRTATEPGWSPFWNRK